VSNHRHGDEIGGCQTLSDQPGSTIALGVSWIKICTIHNTVNLVHDRKRVIIAKVSGDCVADRVGAIKGRTSVMHTVTTGASFVACGDLTSGELTIILNRCAAAMRLLAGSGEGMATSSREHCIFLRNCCLCARKTAATITEIYF
jgi:hypothetical protein